MLIILNCAHTQVEGVVCQNSRTEWSTAACDSCVAQLGKTDNPQPAEADKTATFLLRRLKIPSAGPCSHSLPLPCTSHSCGPSKWFFLFQAVSSCAHYVPHPLQCPLHISLQWTVAYREHLTRATRGCRHDLRWSIIIVLHLFLFHLQQVKHWRPLSGNGAKPRLVAFTFIPSIRAQIWGQASDLLINNSHRGGFF